MFNQVKDFSLTLAEEIKYHESVVEHKKNLESSLWGLEEQASFPENSASVDQNEIIEGIQKCQLKIINCNKLLLAHEKKLIDFINSYKPGEGECSSCGSFKV